MMAPHRIFLRRRGSVLATYRITSKVVPQSIELQPVVLYQKKLTLAPVFDFCALYKRFTFAQT